MFRLSRIRATSIGPDGARFDRPSSGAPAFELDLTIAGRATDTVIWLENGGGKTVFLTLLFHVLRPDHATRIGDELGKKGELPDFLAQDDVAHVQLEWQACDGDGIPTGECLVTGLVAERRPRASGNDRADKTWYALLGRAAAATIAAIPTEADGRRVPKRAFLDRLRDTVQEAGRRAVELRIADTAGKWLTALTEVGLDPALLDYQVTMNRAEGGAAQLFRFSSDEKFLEFLLALVTDPEALDSASETLGRVADKLASLPAKEREVAFADGALTHLEPIAIEHARALKATAVLDQIRAAGRIFGSQMSAAAVAAKQAQERETVRHGLAESRATEADRRRRGLEDERRQLAIDLAEFTLADADRDLKTAKSRETDASLDRDAWHAVSARLEMVRRRERVETLEPRFAAVEAETRPLRERRDGAAAQLRLRLYADSVLLKEAAARAAAQQQEDRELARAQRGEARDCRKQASDRRSEAKELQRRLEAHADARATLVRAGRLGKDEDARAALERQRSVAGIAANRVQEIDSQRESISLLRSELIITDREQTEEALAAAQEARRLADECDGGTRERGRFASHVRIAEVANLAPGDVDLETVGRPVVEQLDAAARSADGRRIDAEVLGSGDRRAVAALESGTALLPPRPEVAAVIERLRSFGMTGASSGWRHLADAITPDRRAAVLELVPELADGVIISEAQLPRAFDVLRAPPMHPTTAVLVGTVEELTAVENAAAPPARARYLVEPAPALYDREAAGGELERRRERVDALETTRAQLEEAAREDRALAVALTQHLETWPPGKLAASLLRAESAAAAAAAARDARDATRAKLRDLQSTDAELAKERPLVEARRREADAAIAALEPVVAEAERLAGAEERAAAALEAAANFELVAEDLEQRADDLDISSAGHATRAAQHLMSAKTAATEATSIAPAHAEEDKLVVDEDSPPWSAVTAAQAIAEGDTAVALRERFTILERELFAATTGSELARDLESARALLAQAMADWFNQTRDVRLRAEALASGAPAQDPVARSAAIAAAEADLADARARTNAKTSARDRAKNERDKLPRPERAGPRPDTPPASADEAMARLTVADEQYFAAADDRSRAEADRDSAKLSADAAGRRATALGQQVTTLFNALREEQLVEGPLPFEGTVEEAIDRVGKMIVEVGTTERELHSATTEWRGHAERLAAYAREERWNELAGLVYRRLAHDPASRLAADAADLSAQLRLLKERLSAEIGSMSAHRDLLNASLSELVSGGVSSLRQATNRSKLPNDLGDWSHRPFLKIDFSPPSEPEIAHRLSAFVTELIGLPADRRPVGPKLLVQAVLACVAGGIRVSVLKPNRAMALTYVAISEMAVLSGGMRATAAIAMFCTLARLRAANRSRGRDRGVATLILDNPLGDASAVYLVSLQRMVADGARIQLVYTTGINDFDALRLFPNPIRLSNAASRRAGLSYVIGDPNFLKLLWPDGDDARIAATRITRNHAPRLVP